VPGGRDPRPGMNAAVEVEGLTKRFGGTLALNSAGWH
jgi:hypothetical protein